MNELPGLVERIGEAFPDLDFDGAVLNARGDDHWVVILDRRWVFRFPRNAERLAYFRAELALLARLPQALPVEVPRYRFVSPSADFGGYRLIEGAQMQPAIFNALPPATRRSVLDRFARFLHILHALPPSIVALADGEITREWTGQMWRARWIAERRALVADRVDARLLGSIDRFYDIFAAAQTPPREVLIHGDITDDHLLLDADGRLGVIDFADACLGDPAYDLAFFFAYGEAMAWTAVRLYDPQGRDPTLIERARRQYVRYRVEQLRSADETQAWEILDELPSLLAATSRFGPR